MCLSMSTREGPYTPAVDTMWSPWFRRAMYTVDTAPMPEAVAVQPKPFSSWATFSSSAAVVGLPMRV